MYKISKETAKNIRQAMEKTTDAKTYVKLQVVALRGEGYSNDQIASVTGYNSNYVGELCKQYLKNGIEEFISDGRKGGNNRHMSEAEAMEFLEQFREKAIKGQVVSIDEIAKAYDNAVGVEHKSLSSIYYFLHLYNWRKIVPKKQHPGKASDEVIEASKKLTLNSKK
jgi:transposase